MSIEKALQTYTYDPIEGTLTHQDSAKPIASREVRVEGGWYVASHLAWYALHGSKPERRVQFIDGNPRNLRPNNLRLAKTEAERAQAARDRAKQQYQERKAKSAPKIPRTKEQAAQAARDRAKQQYQERKAKIEHIEAMRDRARARSAYDRINRGRTPSYTHEQFKEHIELQFIGKMSWRNVSRPGWTIVVTGSGMELQDLHVAWDTKRHGSVTLQP